MSRWRPLAVGALLVLAGCSGLLGSGVDGDVGEQTSVTPAPLPQNGSASVGDGVDPAALPPGIGPDGGVNHTQLRRAHRAALANRSFTLVHRLRAENDSGLRWGRVRTLAAETRRHFRFQYRSFGTPGERISGAEYHHDYRVYADRTGVYERSRDLATGNLSSSRRSAAGVPPPPEISANVTVPFLPDRVDSVRTVERDGRTLYRVAAWTEAAPTDLLVLDGGTDDQRAVSNYTVTAWIRPDGFVRAVAVSYSSDETRTTYTVRVRHRGLGTTNVTEPSWVGAVEARAQGVAGENASSVERGDGPPRGSRQRAEN